ncbi:hypothetical protein [Terrihalobacillus insolitus]|nr:hypothetical protein [Terrihalobacillus insolitus]
MDSLQKKVRSITNLQLLDEALKKVFSAESLENAKNIIEEVTKK